MVFGAMLQSALSATIVELVIFENIDNAQLRLRNYKIKEIVSTYGLKGEPRKVINQLSTSVYEYPLKVEYNFINLLPNMYSKDVFEILGGIYTKKLYLIYQNDINKLKDEKISQDGYKFFIEI